MSARRASPFCLRDELQARNSARLIGYNEGAGDAQTSRPLIRAPWRPR